MALDPYYNNVSLLLPMEGVNNQVVFQDYSPFPIAVTPSGNAKISTTQSKWGAGSGYFDGSGDYLSLPYSEALDLVGSDFSIEGFVYPTHTTNTSGRRILGAGGGTVAFNSTTGLHWLIQISSGGTLSFQYWNGSTGIAREGAAVSSNAWNHFSVCKSGTTIFSAVNGVVTTFTSSALARPSTNPTLRIGIVPGESGSGSNVYTGYLQDVRITKNIARYTAGYTPPGRMLSPELYSAKYVHRGTLPTLKTITGNCIVSGNGGAQLVVIREVATRLLMATATPNATTGAWTADVPPGDYDISYFAPDCRPVCHGPYTVTA